MSVYMLLHLYKLLEPALSFHAPGVAVYLTGRSQAVLTYHDMITDACPGSAECCRSAGFVAALLGHGCCQTLCTSLTRSLQT